MSEDRAQPVTQEVLSAIPLFAGLSRDHLAALADLCQLGVIIAASLCLLGVYLCGHAEKLLGHDAGSIVWDEFAGFAVAVWAVPKSWPVVLAALMIFRFFDIVKPPPAGAAQRLPGGWGIVADDVVAGIYTNLALRGLLLLIA